MDAHHRLELHRNEYASVSNAVLLFLRTAQVQALQRDAEALRLRVQTLLASAENNADAFDIQELHQLRTSVREMIVAIDDHEHLLKDPALGSVPRVSQLVPTGGRPRVEIDRVFLAEAQKDTPDTDIARLVGCSARTVRRRRVDQGLATPAPPVFVVSEEGECARNPESRRGAAANSLSDEDLDSVVADIVREFREHGLAMVMGQLSARGHPNQSKDRVRASLARVTQVPPQFGRRRIERREYRVAGPCSLWHHDGQHGLIEYKIVIHAFIDGYSRYVLGIRASNNNRARTVDDFFVDIIRVHGVPSRVRGDHGVENVLVAERMEQLRGSNRGSYLWGRSVHNTRIERLWVDVVKGVVAAWKDFFRDLEANAGLDRRNNEHIWLLHHLYLSLITQHLLSWAAGWNDHKFSRLPNHPRGRTLPTPRKLFREGVLANGVRSVEFDEEVADEDLPSYGVDLPTTHEEDQVIRSYRNYDPQELDASEENPNGFGRPLRLVDVNVPEPTAPFSEEEIAALDAFLEANVDLTAKDMVLRRAWWVRALDFLRALPR